MFIVYFTVNLSKLHSGFLCKVFNLNMIYIYITSFHQFVPNMVNGHGRRRGHGGQGGFGHVM